MSEIKISFNSRYRRYLSSRFVLGFERILPRRFAARMHRRMEKNSREPQPAVREFGPIGRILCVDGDCAPPATFAGRICVHLHLYYTDMAEEFAQILNRLTVEFVLLVSVSTNQDAPVWQTFFAERVPFAREVIVKRTVNKGRDVLPWLIDFAPEIKRHEIFCHMHTKRSNHNAKLAGWRDFLTRRTFGSRAIVNQILSLFQAEPKLGLIFPPYSGGLGPRHVPPNWGDNERLATTLLTRLEPSYVPGYCSDFPAGSFFWARSCCLEPLFELGLTAEDFEEEEGQLDGTLAHAIERVVGFLPEHAGMEKLCVTVDVDHGASVQSGVCG